MRNLVGHSPCDKVGAGQAVARLAFAASAEGVFQLPSSLRIKTKPDASLRLAAAGCLRSTKKEEEKGGTDRPPGHGAPSHRLVKEVQEATSVALPRAGRFTF